MFNTINQIQCSNMPDLQMTKILIFQYDPPADRLDVLLTNGLGGDAGDETEGED